jgi:hypothetical protein
MTNGQDWGQPGQYPQEGYRQPWPQDQPWQPQQYDPGAHQQRLGGQQNAPQGQPWPQRGPGLPPFLGHQTPFAQQGWQPGYGQQPGSGYGQQPHPGQQPYMPQPQYTLERPAAAEPPRKKRRVFMWVFLAIQAIFLIVIIAGLASHPSGPSAAQQAAQQCANGGWQGLFKSQADCDQHYAVALNDAGNVGKGLGVAIIVVIWCVVDFLLGVTYLIVRLARRRA